MTKTFTTISYHIVSIDGKYCINEYSSFVTDFQKFRIDRISHLHTYMDNYDMVVNLVKNINQEQFYFDYDDKEYEVVDLKNEGLRPWEHDYSRPKFKIVKTIQKSIVTETVEEIQV